MVIQGQIEARPVLPLALSYDHRLLDGAAAGAFLGPMARCRALHSGRALYGSAADQALLQVAWICRRISRQAAGPHHGDWFQTTDARCAGFRARSVVGGIYAPMLLDRERWFKWAHRTP